jgi:hypothetical protein
VLVVPAEVTAVEVEGLIRQWSPDSRRVGETVVAIGNGVFQVYGPVGYDESLWRGAGLPADLVVAYVVRSGLRAVLSAARPGPVPRGRISRSSVGSGKALGRYSTR